MSVLKKIADSLLDFFLPKRGCAVLEKVDKGTIAARCRPVAITHLPYATALFPYKDKDIKALIWCLKYQGDARAATLFAEMLYDFILHELGDELFMGRFVNPVLIAIPASRERIKKHGFNHADMLVRAIMNCDTGNTLSFADKVLGRRGSAKRQTRTKGKAERLLNIKGAFTARDPARVQDRNVILIDDVVTTGATLAEARRTLLASGVREVRAIAIAH